MYSYEDASLRREGIKRIWFIGGGVLAREMYGWLHDVQIHQGTNVPVAGFLDNNLAKEPEKVFTALGEIPDKLQILPIEGFKPQEGDIFVSAMGLPKNKFTLFKDLIEYPFLTVIHPQTVIGYNVKIGKGTVILPFTNITTNVNIENFVTIYPLNFIASDITIGEYSSVLAHGFIGSYTVIGKRVCIHSAAKIADRLYIADDSEIGMASFVRKSVTEKSIMVGSPAYKLR